jgi:hypothetical protein
MAADKNSTSRQVLIELQQIGNVVKVTAIDAVTGIEVSIVGDPRYGVETLKRTAARKLSYVMQKRLKGGGGPGGILA